MTPSWRLLNSFRPIKESFFPPNPTDWSVDLSERFQQFFCARLCGSISTYILPTPPPSLRVMWCGKPSAFQEELVKSPTFLNFADPILHNIVIKDIFAWVYLVTTEQITNRVSLEIIEIGYNSSEMDRDRYSGNCLLNVEADNGEEEKEQKRILCGGGHPTQFPLYEIPWETMNLPMKLPHWHVRSEQS